MNKTPYIRSVRDIKSVHQARICSIPKQQRSVHLDLYVLAREKEKLEKEFFQLQNRTRQVKTRLALANKQMSGLIQEIGRLSQGVKAGQHGPAAVHAGETVKKMRIEY